MKKILVINAGSSSLKYQLIEMENEEVIAKGNCDRIGIDGHISYKKFQGGEVVAEVNEDADFPTHTEAFNELIKRLTTGDTKVIESMNEILAVGHRVVQGAEVFTETCIATDEVIAKIDELAELAPVHNHAHVLALNACKSVLPEGVPQVVVFDTSFHQTMPEKAYMYALPYECYEKFKIRKYGFHGTSHRFVSRKVAELMGKNVEDLKIISCHLGNGSSITAIENGKSIDTTMGFTPLDGLIMGTRCGSIDASAVTYLQEKMGLSPKETSDYLNKKSGFIGVSGISSDNREITKARQEHNHRAEITSEMLSYEIKKYIGSFMAVLNGADVILFTGGIGENAPEVRAEALANLESLGIKLDERLNAVRGKAQKISAEDSKVEVWVVPTNEELLIARDTLEIISK